MIETWHEQFSPKKFLARVNVDQFIKRNEAYNENRVDLLRRPCILCRGTQGPGLLLNDKSYLCKSCFEEVSTVRYPEKYEKLRRKYFADQEARNQARNAFIHSCSYRKVSNFIGTFGWLTLILLFLSVAFIAVPIGLFFVYQTLRNKHENKLSEWDSAYPNPEEPELRHFHDPRAELTPQDRTILKVFNNWPGYPPFWGYLREIVLARDKNRCQVSGCPSRVELHIHHKQPVSKGGEHVPTNLISLCGFHHALEPDEGHERIWGDVKTRYFILVRAHKRHNPSSGGYHDVRTHIRRLELVGKKDLEEIIKFYGLACPSCNGSKLNVSINKQHQKVRVKCLSCSENWEGARRIYEETGPRLAEIMTISKNRGQWKPRWDMLEKRSESTFRLLKKSGSKTKKKRKTIASAKKQNPICPICGSPMRFIKPRKGQRWKAFWGCTKYSTTGCKGSREA